MSERDVNDNNKPAEGSSPVFVYVGTYCAARNNSIFLCQLNPDTGEIKVIKGFKGGENPSYFTFDAQHQFLYAVNERDMYQGRDGGAICAYTIDPKTGFLSLRNRTSSLGALPVYITLSSNGKCALVANYKSGNVSVLPILENGQLAKASALIQHHGTGPDKQRQESPHIHCIMVSPDGRFVFAVDLGSDKVTRYLLNTEENNLLPDTATIAFRSKPGTGPRQLRFHPNGRFAYLIHELKSIITVLSYDHENGEFSDIQTITTLPESYQQENKCSGIRVTSDGRFLYATNRGHNSLAAYTIDASSGKLTLLGNTPSDGDWPREFTIVEGSDMILVANQHSGTIVSLRIDCTSGRLTPTGYQVKIEKPAYVEAIQAFEKN
jgi:6-phosphogluconolactonase